MQELAVLQSTLYALQQQQMMQLNLIQQLQQQLHIQSGDPSASAAANSAELGGLTAGHPKDPEDKYPDAESELGSSRGSTPGASTGIDANDAGQPMTAASRTSSDVRKLEALVMDADASAVTRNLFIQTINSVNSLTINELVVLDVILDELIN